MTRPPEQYSPQTCFWELTRRCELACLHCRAAGDAANSTELSLERSLDLADQMLALGTRLVVLTGGEPTLYRGWERIAQRLAAGQARVRLFISGWGFTAEQMNRACDSGVTQFAVSLDGPAAVHDRLRRPLGRSPRSSFAEARAAIELLTARGLKVRVVTQVNRLNLDHLEEVYELLLDLQVRRWQVLICQISGRARDHRTKLLCDPQDLESVVRVLLRAARERRLVAPQHCTVGYMTAEEAALRGRGSRASAVWNGCAAGKHSFAITPAGVVKGCTTLPDEFGLASVDQRPLRSIWEDDACFPYTRQWSENMLAGRCRACALGRLCRAGCPALAYGASGTIGFNPYCLRLVRDARNLT